MTRKQVLSLAQSQHAEFGRVVDDLPDGWDEIETYPDVTIYNFGIYWNDTPDQLNVVTYGPKPNFDDRTYDHSRYVCYAS